MMPLTEQKARLMPQSLTIQPVQAPRQSRPFDLLQALIDSLDRAEISLQDGDVIAVSSKYAAIAEGRVFKLDEVRPSDRAQKLAKRYGMDAAVAQLALDEAGHIFGGIKMGFLLTARLGIISPNAGLDRSNIPSGQVVLLPADPYGTAETLRRQLGRHSRCRIGLILTDSWLMPGRYGTTGVALAMAGFKPIKDERGKMDLFGNPMTVTQVGIADSLAVCAQVVMGERDEATPFALVRGAKIELTDERRSVDDVSIPWQQCIYIESLTRGLLDDDVQT